MSLRFPVAITMRHWRFDAPGPQAGFRPAARDPARAGRCAEGLPTGCGMATTCEPSPSQVTALGGFKNVAPRPIRPVTSRTRVRPVRRSRTASRRNPGPVA